PEGAMPQSRDRHPFDEGLGFIANALFDSDEQVILRFEVIFDGLMVDDLHGLGTHATPACGPVPDNVSRKEINRRHSAEDQVGCGHVARRNAFNWITAGGTVHATYLAYDAVVELLASANSRPVTNIVSASHLVTYRGYYVHGDLMRRDSAKLTPGSTCFQRIEHLPASPGLPAPAPSKTEAVKTLATSAMMHGQMMHVQR